MALDEVAAYEERGGRISVEIGDDWVVTGREEPPYW